MDGEPIDAGGAFALALLRGAVMLTGLADDLLDEIPPDACQGDEPAAAFIQGISGSIASAMGEVDPREVRRATQLIEAACERVLEHLRLALELRQRMEGEPRGGRGRAYG